MINIVLGMLILIVSVFFVYYQNKNEEVNPKQPIVEKEGNAMKIKVTNQEYVIIYELNDSTAAQELYDQLPLTLNVENYSNNEKIFYPPKALSTDNTPHGDIKVGALSYFQPWGNVVMFYGGNESGGNSLFEIGQAISGEDYINKLSGTLIIEKSLNDY